MIATINIHDVKRTTSRIVWSEYFLNLSTAFFGFLIGKLKSYLNNKIDKLIVSIDQLKEIIPTIDDKSQAESIYVITKNIIRDLDKFDERLQSIEYFKDIQLKKKYKSLLTSLYTTEALVRIVITKGIKVEKTSSYIIEGLSQLSSKSIGESITTTK